MKLNQDTKPEHAFYCADGSALKNLRELAEKLKTISAGAYSHHANEHKNDFRSWIRDVYGNKRLAEKIAAAKNSAEAARIIEEAILPNAPRKKKPAERKVADAAKMKRGKRRKRAKKARLAIAAVVAAKKKEKRKKNPVKKKTIAAKPKAEERKLAAKRRKGKKKRNSKRKNGIGRQLRMIAKRWGIL